MINAKKIYNNLLNYSKITSMVDGDSIMDSYPEDVTIFPSVIFIDDNQRETEYADNKPIANDCSVTVHIFTKAENGYPTTSEIGIAICDVFIENDFSTTMNSEIPDTQKDVRHRVISFRKQMLS